MTELAEARRDGTHEDIVLLLEHEPVITLGRGAKAQNLLASPEHLEELGVDVVETKRGGDVTMHAPGQLIAYPIIDLNPDRKDVRKYVGTLTRTMREIVKAHGLDAGTITGLIGLWTDREDPQAWPGEANVRVPLKLGAIGVRISRWITSHGFALNLTTDLSLFSLIVPCGIQEYGVASVAQLTQSSPDLQTEAERAYALLNDQLGAPHGRLHDLSESSLPSILQRIRHP
jgi:lipoyl(octanoyl) transferase